MIWVNIGKITDNCEQSKRTACLNFCYYNITAKNWLLKNFQKQSLVLDWEETLRRLQLLYSEKLVIGTRLRGWPARTT